ncbi:mucin-3B-like isoform X2 [Tribolium madens]|uniref:mucin-3B-like isoform X2 n=1 Tax=Tribolium madens TaxID=41895 RepID=UPI001CF73FD1|nr:mucin-3B-like isoform X2 [Tribolium madens]
MYSVKISLVLLLLVAFIDFHQCGRYGGSYNDEIQSTVGPDNWGSGLQALAYQSRTTRRSRTTPRRTNPPTTLRRSYPPTTPRRTHPPTTPRSSYPPTTTRRSRTTQRWVEVTTRRSRPTTTTKRTTPPPRPTTTTPRRIQQTTRPWISVTTTTRRTHTTPTPTPWWKTKTTTRWTPPTRPWVSVTTTRRPKTTTRPHYKKETFWADLPPPPGSKVKYGKTKIKIVNKYNYHYPGYYSIPVQHPQHHGYYQTYSTYHYSTSDTGSGILGFYLGYKLGKLSTPTYSHESFYDGYRPRYDHYTIHHYYHNADVIPKRQEIVSNTIIRCVGDSTSVCPTNTTSLCTSDGRLMCVVAATALVTCKDANNQLVNCTSSTMSCVNNTAPECAGINKTSVVVNIPCLSTADIYGDIKFVNNTIVKHEVPPNITSGEVKYVSKMSVNADEINLVNNNESLSTGNSTTGNLHFNGTEGISGGMKYVNNNETLAKLNGTTGNFKDTEGISGEMKYVNNNETLVNSTTTPFTSPTTTPSEYWKWKRSVPQASQQFCVTIVASPAKRKPTQGEEFLEEANSILKKFIETAWDL